MELFRNLRLKFGKAILTNKIARAKRKVSYTGISRVKNIGIVWDASRTDDFICLSRFCQKMHERNIEVKILGYFPGKDLPDQYTAIRYLTCIKNKEINFFYHPTSPETNAFISNRFDILIDINFQKLFPLQYITSLSNAGFKVGLFESETMDTPFDLMMEIKNPVDLDYYLFQVITYLEMIRTGTVKTVLNN
jgi:hypothetical protein